ncbi:phosphonate ABC transporter ATP-binding protein [Marivibrio halodurans]|uniref:Phosphonate ABC transporter ATP-binding protein n=1 Tax=Marivibrio halodurans TaxID=2039722 RepID=A0A8J7RXZ1_9PROT|nr:phosphonate ABC transporter ATP-binding protein [Marivibrio halodurans]MBP5856625.1 phosphonate ABC transporter ATP-binding protein [Marivibrio halodurans]
MLDFKSVSKRFGSVTAVDRVTLRVEEGEMLGIIGRSGAGKSTLLKMTNRLSDPTSGEIAYGGRSVSALKGKDLLAWRRDCAMIFQQFNLVPRLDVLTNVMLGRLNGLGTLKSVFKLFSDEDRRDALRALDRLDIAQTALQQAGTLSGGQQQRVAIARALVQRPRIILADEPIASLDPLNAKLVMDALQRINREEGLTVICNLHTLDTARQYCRRIVGMRKGALVFEGAPEDLTKDAARDIYGAGEEFDEATTSTSLGSSPGADAAASGTAAVPAESERPRVVGL